MDAFFVIVLAVVMLGVAAGAVAVMRTVSAAVHPDPVEGD